MPKTIAVIGVGPGMGRSVARRFGREGFQVALVARNQTRLDAYTGELAADGIQAAGFAGDLADRDALPGMIEAITTRFGPIDVLEYAPSGLDLLNVATAVRDADAASFEFPLDLLLRTPVTLIRQVLPGMLERGDGAVLFGLPVTASVPVPQFGNLATAGAAARGGRRVPATPCTPCTPTWPAPACTRASWRSRARWATATPAIMSSRPMARPTCRSRKSPPTSPTPCGISTSSATGSTRSSEHDPREADGHGRRPPGTQASSHRDRPRRRTLPPKCSPRPPSTKPQLMHPPPAS